MSSSIQIFVLSDTHDHLPPNIEALASGFDEIWHLGDVCAPTILDTLEQIGPPVSIVRGNCDSNFEWPVTLELVRNNIRFQLVHIPPSRTPANVDVVLHGHTHVPRHERTEGVLFLNPGCVTRPNRGAAASVAHLELDPEGNISWHTVRLR